MKKTINGIFSLLLYLLFIGCAQDEIVQPNRQLPDGDKVMVRFSTVIPEYNTVETRANGGVDDMSVLVFDQNGTFITRETATLTNQTDAGGTFSVSLPSSTNPRIVHFICNYNWSDFSNLGMIGSNEQTVVGLLSTTDATFWARRELPNGINTNSFPTANPIELLRNQAKMSVSNDAANFTLQGFTLHNTPNMSSVAPFNTATTHFEEHAITEPIGMGLNPALLTDISLTEKYLFERRNQAASEITTVIIQGIYEGTSYFYKIDLIDSDQVRYNIERNYHYMVKIKTVTKPGYTNFTDALEGASHNNTALDPIIEKYPIISDGISKLQVERTMIIVTETGKTINVGANYYPDLNSNSIDNSGVSVSIFTNEGALQDGSLSYNSSTGKITATAAAIGEEPLAAIIRVQKADLSRTIRVVLRPPFSFDPVTINNNNPAMIEDVQNTPATLRFTVPDDFPVDLFPLPIKIYTQGLYPAASGLQMVVAEGVIHYVYTATTTGVQTVEFKTNKSGNTETVTLTADYFNDGLIDYAIPYVGGITHSDNNTSIPLGATVTASVGSMEITANGKYRYTPPANPNMATEVTFTYSHLVNENTNGGVQQSFHEVYNSVTITIGELYNSSAMHFSTIDHFRVTGKIQYYRNWWYGWSDVPNNSSLSSSNGIATMIETGRYQLVTDGTLANDLTITISYNGYYTTKSIGTLRTNQSLRVE